MTRLLRVQPRRFWHRTTKAAAAAAIAATAVAVVATAAPAFRTRTMSAPPNSDATSNPPTGVDTSSSVNTPTKTSVEIPVDAVKAPVEEPAPVSAVSTSTISSTTSVTKIPGRSSLPEEAASNPHHLIKSGAVVGFKNPYPSWSHSVNFGTIIRRVIWPTLTGEIKQPDTKPPTVPVVKPQWLPDRDSSGKLRATWLGHACYYVEFPSGLRVLFDPVFEDRCSPFTFMGPKRYTPRPCDIKDIPIVDAVVISHSHYDHLSHTSILEVQKYNPEAQFFVGLGLETWFRKAGINHVTERDWWEDADLSVNIKEGDKQRTITARISCLPCQHTSARSLFDKDTTLWCSWAVRSGEKSVWFGGDTGYRGVPYMPPDKDDYSSDLDHLPRCPQFKQIGQLRGPFDLGLIPIGAYAPRSAFSPMHANPFDSVEIFKDTKCERAMGIHWGTWALTTEEVLEPPRMLKQALRRQGIAEEGVFDVCEIGESREF